MKTRGVIELDPAVWSRGPNSLTLLSDINGKRQQCCVGVACTALGVSDDVIRGVAYPYYITEDKLPPAIAELAQLSDDTNVYWLNDSGGSEFDDDRARVKAINSELKRKAIPLRFRLKQPRTFRSASKAKRAVTPAASEAT